MKQSFGPGQCPRDRRRTLAQSHCVGNAGLPGTLNIGVKGISREKAANSRPIDKDRTPSYLCGSTSQARPAGLFMLPAKA
jgi:hypothetical protein